MAVSKRLRYEVLRRDSHTCRYCGAKAPDVEITVDHVVPVALGGTDKPSNLVAACRDCNGGKTSASPDAPLVADVSDDAVRWAVAMRSAQTVMLADIDAREAARDQFAEWWDEWGYGSGQWRKTFPRPDDWEHTVDNLTAAGLPLRVLKECIERAMARKQVTGGEKFRYMCGVAWKKLTELQEHAQKLAGGGVASSEDDSGPPIMSGRAGFARELLAYCEGGELERLREEARDDRGATTEDEEYIQAAIVAWEEARHELFWLAFSVCELLPLIPDEVIQTAMLRARHELYDESGEDFSRSAFAERAANAAVRGYEDKRDAAYLAAMPEEERAEWIAYAGALYAGTRDGQLNGRSAIKWPAACARNIKEQRHLYPGMCLARGKHIERCPAWATHHLWFADFDCCRDPDGEHEGHPFCDMHAEMALAGELIRNNEPVTLIDYKLITGTEETVPF